MDNRFVEELEPIKESVKNGAIRVVSEKYALKAVELEDLLSDDKYRLVATDITVDINIPAPKITISTTDDSDGQPSAKRRKLTVSGLDLSVITATDDKDSDHKKPVLFPEGVVHCNPILHELVAIVRAQVYELLSDILALRNAIHLLKPRIEDGNNFGVEVQQEVLDWLAVIEDETVSRFNTIQTYYTVRADLISKLADHPYSQDYRCAVRERDHFFHGFLCTSLTIVRNYYLLLHDMVLKNAIKIQNPKSAANDVSIY